MKKNYEKFGMGDIVRSIGFKDVTIVLLSNINNNGTAKVIHVGKWAKGTIVNAFQCVDIYRSDKYLIKK